MSGLDLGPPSYATTRQNQIEAPPLRDVIPAVFTPIPNDMNLFAPKMALTEVEQLREQLKHLEEHRKRVRDGFRKLFERESDRLVQQSVLKHEAPPGASSAWIPTKQEINAAFDSITATDGQHNNILTDTSRLDWTGAPDATSKEWLTKALFQLLEGYCGECRHYDEAMKIKQQELQDRIRQLERNQPAGSPLRF